MRRILGAFAVALTGILILQWFDWPPPPSRAGLGGETRAAADAAAGAETDPLAKLEPADPKEHYASVIERPLFRPDRKPEDPQEDEPEPEPDPIQATALDGIDLSAVMLTPSAASAWVKGPKDAELRRIRTGDDYDGWMVKEILADRVVLERQGEEDALILRDYANMPPAPVRPTPVAQRKPPVTQRMRPPRGQEQEPQDGEEPDEPPQSPGTRPNVRRPTPQRPH